MWFKVVEKAAGASPREKVNGSCETGCRDLGVIGVVGMMAGLILRGRQRVNGRDRWFSMSYGAVDLVK